MWTIMNCSIHEHLPHFYLFRPRLHHHRPLRLLQWASLPIWSPQIHCNELFFAFQIPSVFLWMKKGVLITMKSYKHYLNCTYVSLPRFHWDTRHRSYLQMKWTFFVRLMLSCFGYWGYHNEIVGKCENRSCKSAEECGKNAFQTIFTVQPTLRHPIDQCLARPGLHNWMVFSVHRFSCVHNLCRADGMFAAHLIRQIWCSSDVYWVRTIEIINKSECEKKEWKKKSKTYCDTECLSKLLDVFKMPLHGFFASGDPCAWLTSIFCWIIQYNRFNLLLRLLHKHQAFGSRGVNFLWRMLIGC